MEMREFSNTMRQVLNESVSMFNRGELKKHVRMYIKWQTFMHGLDAWEVSYLNYLCDTNYRFQRITRIY